MYHFQDLYSNQFVGPSHPDEEDTEAQRSYLEKTLPSVYEKYPRSVVGIIHIDDRTDELDWRSTKVIGPKGGAAVIDEAPSAMDSDTFRSATKAYRAAMLSAHNDFLSLAAKLLSEYEAKIMKQSKPQGPTVTKAGYDARGNWLEQGPLKAQKKPRR